MAKLGMVDELKLIRESHRGIRRKLKLKPRDHLLTSERVAAIIRVCRYPLFKRLEPKKNERQAAWKNRIAEKYVPPYEYSLYQLAHFFVKEHLIQALKEKHGLPLAGEQRKFVRRFLGKTWYQSKPEVLEEQIAAVQELKERADGEKIFNAVTAELKDLWKQVKGAEEPVYKLDKQFMESLQKKKRKFLKLKDPYFLNVGRDMFFNVVRTMLVVHYEGFDRAIQYYRAGLIS